MKDPIVILKELAGGVDPLTSRKFEPSDLYKFDELMEELRNACKVLESRQKAHFKNTSSRSRTYDSWDKEEEKKILEAYDAGEYMEEIAARHQRTFAAIKSRLMKLKKFMPRQ